jgi:predicted esterase
MNEHTAGHLNHPEATPPQTNRTPGRFVTETLLEYDGGRQVTAYLPPVTPEAVVFAADGQGFSKWGRLLETAASPSTMIVGVHGLSDEMSRLREYSPVFDSNRFTAHETFFVEDVRRWVQTRFDVALPPERTVVFGYSAGAELAVALGLRHRDVYGAVVAGSPGGGYQPNGTLPHTLPRTFLFAGTLEPFFLDNATRWAHALREAGADVMMKERDVSHGAKHWRADFPLMLSWALAQ